MCGARGTPYNAVSPACRQVLFELSLCRSYRFLIGDEIVDISGTPFPAPIEIDQSSQVTVAPVEIKERATPKPDAIILDGTSSDELDQDDVVVTRVKQGRPAPLLDRAHRRTPGIQPVDLTKVQTPAIQRRPEPQTDRVWPGTRNLTDYLTDLFNPIQRNQEPAVDDFLGWFRRPQRRLPAAPAPIPVPQVEELEVEPGKRVVLSEVKCPVCYEAVSTPASTICGHIFCFNCIRLSQQAQKQCPVCRTKLTTKQFHRLFM